MNEIRPARTALAVARALVASLAVLAIALAGVGWAIERRMRDEIRERAVAQLSALAEVKVQQISDWRAERLADVAAIAAPPLDAADLALLARGRPPPALAAWYRGIQERHVYADVLVVSSRGELLFSAAGRLGRLDGPTADAASRALAQGGPVLSDLHRSARDGGAYLDAAAPIPAEEPRAALVLRIDADTLFPLLQAWPAAAASVEALLVRRDGDDVLFLSELRHESGAALRKRVPLSESSALAAQAASGALGVREGLDYRGVPSLAEIRAVPDSTWSLVAKVDRDELFATERHLAWAAWFALSAFLALGGLLVATWMRAERQRRAAAERTALDDALRYRAQVLDNVADAVVATGADLRITSWNPAAERIYGWTAAEALGRIHPELVEPHYGTAQTRDWMLGELQRHGRVELSLQQRRKDGVLVDIDATVVALRDLEGRFLGYIGVNRDATERRRAEAELKRASERLAVADRMASVGTLAAGVAHEINNPLAYVISNLSSASEGAAALPGAEELREALAEAREGAERVRRIVGELRTFSRPDEAARGPLDVRRVLDAAVNLARHEIRHRARVAKRYEDVPAVDANESRLAQAFLNLIVNAAQAIPEGSKDANQIVLSARLAEGRVRVDVSDTGVGIASEHLGRIFDPFYTTKPVGVGTGLGLSICHGIVASLGGEIRVESSPGRGSKFSVALPPSALPLPQAAERPPAAPPGPGRRGRVLVVDDEPPLCQTLRRTLDRDHDVVAVSSGRAALELVASGERFDVILCDLMMPEITGMDLSERLAREAPDAARSMVFMTGGAFTDRAREFLDDPSRRHIEKPFDLDTVRALVRELVGP